jgi:D-alanyl-D-alanine carboxypeptidase (penicillin-binding protein 5/6)
VALVASLLPAQAGDSPPTDAFPKAASAYVVAVDGRILWARAPDASRAPASLTKMMTALVALDSGFDPAAVVTVGAVPAAATGAKLGLTRGEKMTAGDLWTAMLVRSANDACLALAEHVAGSVDVFVERMNARAAEMGLAATHFTNPCGLDDAAHRSSARDLWRLAEQALSHDALARTVALERARVRTLGGRAFDLATSNALLGRLPGAVGIKSGFTSKAGKCVAAAAERSGVRVVAILLDSGDRWWAAAAMIEKAFETAGQDR